MIDGRLFFFVHHHLLIVVNVGCPWFCRLRHVDCLEARQIVLVLGTSITTVCCLLVMVLACLALPCQEMRNERLFFKVFSKPVTFRDVTLILSPHSKFKVFILNVEFRSDTRHSPLLF
jgi:hypothetical protein